MLKYSLSMVLPLFLVGCSSMQIDDPGSPYYRPPAGSVVQLNQTLTVPGQRTRVFMQHGAVSGQLDLYAPHCNFEVRELQPGKQQIEAERFTVTRVQQGGEPVVRLSGWQLAGPLWTFSFGDPPVISRYYHYYLESEQQPNVLRLTCHAGQADAPRAELPTLLEMREAMGDLVTFEPKS